jgi:outer membrane immunogenic protein
MKNILLWGAAAAAAICVTSANAADLPYPTKAPQYGSAPVFSWTGCHIGAHAGAAANHTKMADPVANGAIDATMTGQVANIDGAGGFAGGQIGCDYQFSGNWVAGIEASASGANITGTNQDQFNFNWTLRSQNDWFGSVTGRLGWAVDRVLFYGRGGFAFAHNKFEIENANISLGSPSATRTGWVIGSGVEWAIAPNWSVFAEADYYQFGDKNVQFQGNIPLAGNPPFYVGTKENVEAVKFGVNYRL